MAIQVPVSTPNAPQAVNPEPFLSAYLSRPTSYQAAGAQIGQGMQSLVDYQKYNLQRKLEALNAISGLYGAGGPRAVQNYGGIVNQIAGSPVIGGQQQGVSQMPQTGQTYPSTAGVGGNIGSWSYSPVDQSQQAAQAGNASYAPANGGGGLPSNGSTAPQGTANNLGNPNAMPMGQGGGTGGAQPWSSAQPYSQAPSSQGTPQTIGGQSGGTDTMTPMQIGNSGTGGGTGGGSVQPGGTQPQQSTQSTLNDPAIQQHAQSIGWDTNYAGQLQNLQGQMQAYNDSGAYGTKMQEGLAKQVPIITAQMNDARERQQFQENQTRETNQFNQQQNLEKQKTVGSEVSKQGEVTAELSGVQKMFDNIDKNLSAYYSKPNYVGSANLAGKTGGRMGSTEGSLVLKQAKPMVASINKLLTHRFNMGENELLNESLAPSPNYTPQYNAAIMKQLHSLIMTAQQGNIQNVRNVAASVNAQVPQLISGANNGQQ